MRLLGESLAWVGLISKYRAGSWQLYQTEDAARYFNFKGSSAEDEGGECAVVGGRARGWSVTSCDRGHLRGQPVRVLCERLPASRRGQRVNMGKSQCDDAVKNIDRDLASRERDTHCHTDYDGQDRKLLLIEGKEKSSEKCEDVHEKYVPNHICMTQTINYTDFGRIPTHGPHRPNWASFGQYR